jgi:DNA-binding IclR family transcriptional regulator
VRPSRLAELREDNGEHITSLERGLSVLRAFSSERPEMTLSQVAAETHLSAATARRCLHTLVNLGYAAQRGKLFVLRPTVVAFASAYLDSMNLELIVRPYLQEVRDKTGDSASLAVLADTDILYLVHVSTNRMVRVPCAVGTRLPAYPTSLGRVLLAYRSKEVLDDYFRKTRLVRNPCRGELLHLHRPHQQGRHDADAAARPEGSGALHRDRAAPLSDAGPLAGSVAIQLFHSRDEAMRAPSAMAANFR